MALDAKIGSLIGLVLIFAIALVVNGLLRSDDATDGSAPNAVTADNMPGIGARERDFIDRPADPIAEQREYRPPTADNGATGSRASLPGTAPVVPEPTTDGDSEVPRPDPVKPSLSQVYYAVCTGDNLADIAKKFYGPEEGNRRANIIRIFEANRKVLTSPHEIFIGQKLVIPPLKALGPDGSFFSSSMFESVTSIGRRHLSTHERNVKQSQQYAVQEGDSLWRIAATLLGDGSRYEEIRELNAGILKDEDRIIVGMRLTVPAR